MRTRASALAAYAVALCVAVCAAQHASEVEKLLMEMRLSEPAQLPLPPPPPTDAPRLPVAQSTPQLPSESEAQLSSRASTGVVSPFRSSAPQPPTQSPSERPQETSRPSLLTPFQSSSEPTHSSLDTAQQHPSQSPPLPHPQSPFEPSLHASPTPQLRTPTLSDLPPSASSWHSAPQASQSSLTSRNARSQQTPQPSPDSSSQTAPKSPHELPQQVSQSPLQSQPQLTPQSPPEPLPQPPDSGVECTCLRKWLPRQWLNCSGRSRSTLREEDLCEHTTVVFLSNNNFVSLPANLSGDIMGVNISHNLLTTIPRSPPLHPRTHTLDVSFNRIEYSRDELRPLSYLRTLSVRGNRLQSLNFLPSPCSMSSLWADHNQLRSLDGPINDCFVLRDLDVSWNQLGPLPKDAIQGLDNVQRLKMFHAGLTSIAPGAFDGLRSVQFFDLSENELTTLPSRAFMHKFLETLLLDKNKIFSLPPDVFSGLRKVRKISLAQNKLEYLPQNLFSDLQNLEHLNLSQNYLRHLPEKVFSGLKNLTEICLQNNSLGMLPPQLFYELKFLKRINLGGNMLATVPGDLLSGLSNLELLDLSENRLTTVPDGLFKGVNSIKMLDLSSNSLSTFSGSQLEGLDHVERLNLKRNQLTELQVFDPSWPQVMSFNLENNNIEELSEAAVRSWLGDGSRARRVTLGGRQRLRSVASLRWVVGDPHVTAIVDVADCRCGFVNRGRAHVFFCASVWCPADAANWVDEASRSAAPHTYNERTAP